VNWLSPTKLPFSNLDLTPWAGRQVRVTFRSDNNETYPTEFWIDNLSLEVCLGVHLFANDFESGDLVAW